VSQARLHPETRPRQEKGTEAVRRLLVPSPDRPQALSDKVGRECLLASLWRASVTIGSSARKAIAHIRQVPVHFR